MPPLPTGERGHTRSFDERWSDVRDSLLRGLAHALSNRIATIGSIAEFLRMGDEDPASLAEMLSVETGRLGELLEQMRALSAPQSHRQSAFRLSDAVAAAIALHDFHPDRRTVELTVDAGDDARPMLGDGGLLQRMLVIMLDAATLAAQPYAKRAVQVRCRIEGDVGIVRICAGAEAPSVERPACGAGEIVVSAVEDDAGACYLLAVSALGART